MLRRAGLVMGGLFLSAILANVYYIGFCFVFVLVIGVQNELFLRAGFWSCFLAAVGTLAYFFRRAWSSEASVATPATSDSKRKNEAGFMDA